VWCTSPDRPLDSTPWIPLQKLLHRPWWRRAWIVEEATTAKSAWTTSAWCGRQRLLLGFFELAHHYFSKAARIDPGTFTPIYSLKLEILMAIQSQRHDPKSEGDLDLLTLLRLARSYSATDAKDKVYSILAAAVDDQDRGLRPDYSRPTDEIYVDLAMHLINRDRTLDVLGFCDMDSNTFGLPSRVPDWSSNPRRWHLCKRHLRPGGFYSKVYNANKGSVARAQFSPDHRVLRIEGFMFDDVSQAAKARTGTSDEDVAHDWACTALADDSLEYIGGGTRLNAFQHTLRADVEEDNARFSYRGASITWPERVDGEYSSSVFQNPNIVNKMTCGRRLIKTSSGYVGIVPSYTEPGDIVCILSGGQTPFILREEEHHHLLVGECYIHGIMDGEAVTAFDEGNGRRSVFDIW